MTEESLRNQTILQCSIAGILMNLILGLAKLIIGLMIRSRAVVLDALNGFSDMVSSLLSLFSVLFASKRADRKHPFGYGRLEYITSLISTLFILAMSIRAIVSAIQDLAGGDAATPKYNTAVIVLMSVSLAAKILYGLVSRRAGTRFQAVALIICGTESIGDAVISAAILATIAVNRLTGLNLEPWLSILISLFLIKTCMELIRVCVSKLLGTKGDTAVYASMKKLIIREPEVLNVFNLIIHNYGEELSVASVDIEVDETMTTAETTRLVRRIMRNAAGEGIRVSSVGVYGTNTRNPAIAEMWDSILPAIRRHPECARAYAFCYDEAEHAASFAVVLDPPVRKEAQLIHTLKCELEELFPGVEFTIETALDL